MNSTLKEKQRYKKTELGWMPEDWEIVNFENIAEIRKNKIDPNKVDNYQCIELENIEQETGRILGACCSREKTSIKSVFYKGDILFGKLRPYLRKFWLAKFDGVCSTEIFVFKPINKSISEFVFYTVQVDQFIENSVSKSFGTKMPRTSWDIVKAYKLPLPALEEQQKIAEILSTVDEKIDQIDKQIEETEQLKKGLMQELLTKGIGHTEFKDSEIGLLPKCWEVVKLADITEKISDGIHTTPKYTSESKYYFINGNNLANGYIEITDKTKCVSFDEYMLHKKELGDNTILLSINGTIGNLAFYNNEQVILGKSACYINLRKNINKKFIYYILDSQPVKTYFNLELTGTTIRNLSIQSIKNTKLPFPSLEEQQKIAEILNTVDERFKTLQNKKSEYENLKKGLMQKLLTGQIRVRV